MKAIKRKKGTGGQRTYSTEQEAQIVALSKEPPPEGRSSWSSRLLSEHVANRGIVDSLSRETIRKIMKEHQNGKPSIEVGDFVKIRSHAERFWCEVIGFDDVGMQVRVNNDLTKAPYSFGDVLCLSPDQEILQVMKKEDL